MQLCGANNIVNYNFSYYYKNLLFMFVEYMNEGCLTDFIFEYIFKSLFVIKNNFKQL